MSEAMSRPLTYRKRPARVTAVLVQEGEPMEKAARWCGGAAKSETKASDHTDVAHWIEVPTLRGVVKARPGEYIVKDADGRFFVWERRAFDAEYERVGLR